MFVSITSELKAIAAFVHKHMTQENFLSHLLGGYAMGAGFGRRLGHSTEWLYEREGVLAVSSF